MNDRIVPAPSLSAVASPVDRFIAPVKQVAAVDPLENVAKTLQNINPAIKDYLLERHTKQVTGEEAQGYNSGAGIAPEKAIEDNRLGWKSLIDTQRKADEANGTNYAGRLAASSPHFRRGKAKAQAQRLGMAFNDVLAAAYAKNPEVTVGEQTLNLQDVDDPRVFQEWAQGLANTYAQNNGLSTIDPVILSASYSPVVLQGIDAIQSTHTTTRLDRYLTEYKDELSAGVGLKLSAEGNGNSSVETFIDKIAVNESGSDYNRVNTLGYTGKLQYGQPRLDDYNRQAGTKHKLKDLLNNAPLQDKINLWHFNDIDKSIEEGGYLNKGFSLDGLRAVAHLGGTNGMAKFAATGGKHNPSDAYGTSLLDYYKKYSGPATDIQSAANEAIGNGIDPTEVNKLVVNAIINDAISNRDETILSTLDGVNAGSGPLSNIGWVKAKITAAQDKIDDLAHQDETRAIARHERERLEIARELTTAGTRNILVNPEADHTEFYKDVVDAGYPELVTKFRAFQTSVLSANNTVHTAPEDFTDMRVRILNADTPQVQQELALELLDGARTRKYSTAHVETLFRALDSRGRNKDIRAEKRVVDLFGRVDRAIKARFGTSDDWGVKSGGDEQAFSAFIELDDEWTDWLDENPEASKREKIKALQDMSATLLNRADWKNPEADTPQVKLLGGASDRATDQTGGESGNNEQASTEGTASPAILEILTDPTAALATLDSNNPEHAALINEAAIRLKMTAEEFYQRYGGQEEQ